MHNKLLSEISKYNPSVEETDTSALQIIIRDQTTIQEYDDDIEKNIIQQLSTLHNPFLMKAMEDYMPLELYTNDTVDVPVYTNADNSTTKRSQMHNLYKKYKTYLHKYKY